MTTSGPYTPGYIQVNTTFALKPVYRWLPQGPGTGFGSNSGYLFHNAHGFDSEYECQRVCAMMNKAYHQGQEDLKRDLRKLIGAT